jgi:hypothetical protein
VGLNSLKSLNLTNVYPNNNKNNKKKKNNNNKKNNKVKSKPLELFELAGKNYFTIKIQCQTSKIRFARASQNFQGGGQNKFRGAPLYYPYAHDASEAAKHTIHLYSIGRQGVCLEVNS